MSRSVLIMCAVALLAPSAGADDGASILRKYASARRALDRVSATYRYAVEQVVYQGDDVLSRATSATIAEFRRDRDRYEFITRAATDETSARAAIKSR